MFIYSWVETYILSVAGRVDIEKAGAISLSKPPRDILWLKTPAVIIYP